MAEDEEPRVVEGNTDDLIRQIEQDELDDASKLSVREYALARGMQPQLVHYYIGRGRLKVERCICGRKVLDVKTADEFFATKKDQRSNG
jgi:hypothetical protein